MFFYLCYRALKWNGKKNVLLHKISLYIWEENAKSSRLWRTLR